MRQIICVGDLCCDLIVPYGKMKQALRLGDISKETTDALQVEMQCGGSVGNAARHLGSMQAHPVFVTPLKTDSLGQYLQDQMEAAGVDMRWASASNHSNMYCVAVLDEYGERTMFCLVPPWADFPRFHENSFSRVLERIQSIAEKAGSRDDMPILFTSGMAFLEDPENNRSVLDFFKAAKKLGAEIVFDLNVRAESYGYEGTRRTDMEKMIALSDIVLGSGADEFFQVTGCTEIRKAAAKILDCMQQGGIVVARDGAAPVLVLERTETVGKGRDQVTDADRVHCEQVIDAGSVDGEQVTDTGRVHCEQVIDAGSVHCEQVTDADKVYYVRVTEVETPKVVPVSTLGAGDAFDAKMLCAVALGKGILSAVQEASIYASQFISIRH